MSQPLRRFAFRLAEKLKMSGPDEVFRILNPRQIYEWMAYYQTKDDKWLENYEQERSFIASDKMSDEERSALFRQALGGFNG